MRVNDTIRVTPGSGATVATWVPGGSGTTELQVVVLADATGHLYETKPTHFLSVPKITASANRYHWELFNNSASTVTVAVHEIKAMVHTDVAVTGAVGVRFDFFRTTALSSGGTAGTYESSSTLAANFARLDTNDSLISSGVSAKTVLTSITTGAYLFTTLTFTEETNAASNLHQGYNLLSDRPYTKPLTLRPGQGVAVRQGTVASVGEISWRLLLTTDPD